MQLDSNMIPFSMNMIDLESAKVLVRPSQAESTAGKNVITGDPREEGKVEKTSDH